MVKRPKQIALRPAITSDQIERAHYGGSPEHKVKRWWGGLPEAMLDDDGNPWRPGKELTTICPLVTRAERDQATIWIREALRKGQVRYYEGDDIFPKRLWLQVDEQTWTGYLINSGNGEYKGWPINEEERIEIFG